MTVFLRCAPRLSGAVCLMAVFSAWGADIRVDSNLVLIPVSVTDPKNHPVTGLRREDFRVFEGKAEQTLMQFASEDAPVSVGIVFDTSGSMKDKLAESREAVARFLETAGPQDEFFLVNFSGTAEIAVPFTGDAGTIENRLLYTGPQGRTSLLDAMGLAMDYMKNASNPRRALLVISDGGDNHSRFTESEIRRKVRETDVWIYAIGIGERGAIMLPEETRGDTLMQGIAEESGGRLFAARNAAEMPEIARSIGLELRNQYLIGYRPSNLARGGKYRKVQVKVVDGRALRVTWRPGYFVPE
ncbi:MAG TPA: VWA domain-containing protein [Bryobacteraceae bacterium]|nr:VWA domain-containing protein [Bryobacteraceae bacterium]